MNVTKHERNVVFSFEIPLATNLMQNYTNGGLKIQNSGKIPLVQHLKKMSVFIEKFSRFEPIFLCLLL